MRYLKLYVPAPGSAWRTLVAHGSAIVGKPADEEHTLIHYEGNLYAATNLTDFPSRAQSAAGRLDKNYPTVAKAVVPTAALVEVGEYDVETSQVRTLTNPSALAEWLKPEPLPALGAPRPAVPARRPKP